MPIRAAVRKFSVKRHVGTVVALALAALVVGEGAFLAFHQPIPKPANVIPSLWTGDYAVAQQHWKQEIDQLGATKAYDLFKQDTQGKPLPTAHTLAHIFGQLLYEKEGISGVGVCDSSFAFGCYHSFFSMAIDDYGTGVATKLDQACIAAWGPKGLGCQHGIGHGLMAYLGDSKLVDALNICSTLSWKGPIGGCTSGAFMEYNFHTMESLAGAGNRVYDPNDPQYPCDKVPGQFTQACYFEQPEWWSQVFPADYAKVGRLCAAASGELNIDACFRGLGNTIGPASGYEATSTLASCLLMPDDNSKLLCREGASWAFYAEPTAKDKAAGLCAGLSDALKQECQSGFDLTDDRL